MFIIDAQQAYGPSLIVLAFIYVNNIFNNFYKRYKYNMRIFRKFIFRTQESYKINRSKL